MTTLIKPLLVTIWDKRRIRQQGRVCLAATSINLKQKRVSSMGHGTKLPQPSMLLRPTLIIDFCASRNFQANDIHFLIVYTLKINHLC
jgi:hypothetical protein